MPVDSTILAQLSASAYRNVTERNRILAPAGWEQIATYPAGEQGSDSRITGFSAAAYRGPGGEIVIAYAGTNQGYVGDDAFGNIPAAPGEYSPQVLAAMQLYIRVKRQYAADDAQRISFTGHSPGGGLASLMAVYFDRPATVFAPAPFELSATRAPLINDDTGRLRAQGRRTSRRRRHTGRVRSASQAAAASRTCGPTRRSTSAW